MITFEGELNDFISEDASKVPANVKKSKIFVYLQRINKLQLVCDLDANTIANTQMIPEIREFLQ